MRKKFTVKRILIGLVVLLVIFQFFRIDKTNPPVVPERDFAVVTSAPAEVAAILKTSCYDCHGNTSVYPWYSNIAPVSWWLKNHINDGRRHLNFSEWGTYSTKKADHKLEECVEMVEEGEMPMSSYTIIHGDAKLSAAQKTILINWFKSLRKPEAEKSGEVD